MMRISGERAALGIVVGGFLLLQIPFLFVPFRVDEPNILAIAKQIAADPFDPYGFEINWLGTPQPASEVLRNPPLVPYWIAGWAVVFGWSETSLHSSMLLWAAVALIAVARLAPKAGMAGWMGAALLGSSVIFFVSAPLLMPDVVALALSAAAVALALKNDWPALAGAMFAAAAAPLAKYTAIAIVVPLAVLAFQSRRRWLRAMVALAPLVSLLLWSRISDALYGSSHVTASATAQGGLKLPVLSILVDLGMAVFPIGLFAIALGRRRIALASVATVALSFPMFVFLTENRVDSAFLASVGAAVAVTVLAAGVESLRLRPDLFRVAFVCWLGASVVLGFGYQFVTSRYFLAAAVAAVILLGDRSVPRLFPLALLAGVCLSVAVAVSDAQHASIYPRAARSFVAPSPGAAWLAGHWGFQHYGSAEGGRMIDLDSLEGVHPGDRIVVSESTFPGTSVRSLIRHFRGDQLETIVFRSRWPVRTQACGPTISLHGAGASSCENAYRVAIPWGFSTEPLETIHVFEATEGGR